MYFLIYSQILEVLTKNVFHLFSSLINTTAAANSSPVCPLVRSPTKTKRIPQLLVSKLKIRLLR